MRSVLISFLDATSQTRTPSCNPAHAREKWDRRAPDVFRTDDDGIAARKEAAKSQRAETVRKSAAVRVKLSTQVHSIRADHPALRDECDRLSATLADAPTITKAHARAVRDLLVSAVLAVDVELDEG